MCQPSPGPRCFKDSSVKLSKLQDKAATISARNAEVQAKLDDARKSGNAREVQKLSTTLKEGTARYEDLEKQIRHTQRDVDGTRTGQRALKEQLEEAGNTPEARELIARLHAAEALRFARTHALELANSGRPPMIRITKKVAA